ncbi:MAG TPA: type II toxin-antitoxin system RelE/ParE family toxin [Candidatus Limnocylindria bacterium]|nr:type II toxin-antitoxin system RelE/ParE family toxin [Candidatus Limnocylindria bacterium]
MPGPRVRLLPEVAELLRRLPPDRKRKVRAALDELQRDPDLGEPLGRELAGLWRIRVGQLRVVYGRRSGALEVVAIGPRRTVYTELEREARSSR